MKKIAIYLLIGFCFFACDKGINVIPLDESSDLSLNVIGRYDVKDLQYKNFTYKLPTTTNSARLSIVRADYDKVNMYVSLYEGVIRIEYFTFPNVQLALNPDKSVAFVQGVESVGSITNNDIDIVKMADLSKVRFWMTAKR